MKKNRIASYARRYPGIYLLQSDNRNTRIIYEICSKLKIERIHQNDFNNALVQVFPLLTWRQSQVRQCLTRRCCVVQLFKKISQNSREIPTVEAQAFNFTIKSNFIAAVFQQILRSYSEQLFPEQLPETTSACLKSTSTILQQKAKLVQTNGKGKPFLITENCIFNLTTITAEWLI